MKSVHCLQAHFDAFCSFDEGMGQYIGAFVDAVCGELVFDLIRRIEFPYEETVVYSGSLSCCFVPSNFYLSVGTTCQSWRFCRLG